MKFQLDRKSLLRSVVLVILIVAMLFGAAELVLLVDLGGLDFAVTFLLVYFAAIRDTIIYKYRILKSETGVAIKLLSQLYIFQPKVFLAHATASGLLVTLTCSVFLVCLMWVPLIYLSSGFVG